MKRRSLLRRLAGGAMALLFGKMQGRAVSKMKGRISFILPQRDGSLLVGYKGIERYTPGYVYCPYPPFPLSPDIEINLPNPRTAHMKPSDFVKDGNLARFLFLRQGQAFYYVRRLGTNELYMFPVPLADVGDATLNVTEKALTLMRYIRLAIHEGTMVLKVDAEPLLLKDQGPSGGELYLTQPPPYVAVDAMVGGE